MAVYNELMVGRYVRLLQKIFSMKGRQPAPLTVAGEIMPVLPIFYGRESRYLEQWESFIANTALVGAAAVTTSIRYRNPVGSNVVIVFEKLQFIENVADTGLVINMGALSTDLTTLFALTSNRMDGRGRPQPTMIASGQTAAPGNPGGRAVNISMPIVNTPADLIIADIQEICLLPGDCIQFNTGALNTTLNVNAMWRERILEESELK